MIEGALSWLSPTKSFGFVTAQDGSRDVFACFSSRETLDITKGENGKDDLPVGVVAPAREREEGIEPLCSTAKVEVRTRYQVGHWARGYEITEIVATGYHVG
jgi:cold shock CspA family protein